jgi:hypothetical protein
MKQTVAFTEGLGAGAGAVLIIGALLLLARGRTSASSMRRFGGVGRSRRSAIAGAPPANYLDVCRAAGL